MGFWLSFRNVAGLIVLSATSLGILSVVGAVEGQGTPTTDGAAKRNAANPRRGFRGFFFNPNIRHDGMDGYPWPVFDPYGKEYRAKIRTALRELAIEANINLIDVFIPIPFTLAHPPKAPRADQPLSQWANIAYLNNVAVFVDDCHDAGISVAFDLADNRWIPYSVDSKHHIGRPGGKSWPVADESPWDESATWYREIINYVESRAKHPESIAMWGMMGNYQWGTAEPCLWNCDYNPAIESNTEEFVKRVWPVFRSAGKRPKATPIMLPMFSNGSYWAAKTPETRLSAFTNLKKWIVDDLALPPDYWVMTTYPYCDPAPDGVHYLRRIVEILGKNNASRIISTDFKGPGHDEERKGTIVGAGGHSGRDLLEWHFRKCAEYGFAGWWIYSYQDQEVSNQRTGLRSLDGQWKSDLVQAIRQQASGR